MINSFHERVINEVKHLIDKSNEIYLTEYSADDDIILDLLSNVKSGTYLINNYYANHKIPCKIFCL